MKKHQQCHHYAPLQINDKEEDFINFSNPSPDKRTNHQRATLVLIALAVCYVAIRKIRYGDLEIPSTGSANPSLMPSSMPSLHPISLVPAKSGKHHAFPGMIDETCLHSGKNECSTRVAVELYKYWNDETQALDDPPFSPLFYSDDDSGITIRCTSNMEGWGLEDCLPASPADCKTFAEVVQYSEDDHCPMHKPFDSFVFDVDGAKAFWSMDWYQSPCSEIMPVDDVVRDDLVFLDGHKKGYLVDFNDYPVVTVFVEDPRADSCWSFVCKEGADVDACYEDVQTGLVELSVADFYENIMKLSCNS